MDKDNVRIDFLNSSLERNLAWVTSADNKVPAIFAIDMAMLGVLCGLAPKANEWTTWAAVLAALAGIALLVSIVLLARVGFPKLNGPKGSVVYFGGIVHQSEAAFVKKLLGGVSEEIFEDLARQVYRNAEIAMEKFTYIRQATLCMFISVPFWLASVAILYANR